MGLLNWILRKPSAQPVVLVENLKNEPVNEQQPKTLDVNTDLGVKPEIPEKVFIEFEKPKLISHMEPTEEKFETNDLHLLYRFLEQNFEKKGYEDALMNPDTSSMEEQVLYIQNELNLVISKVKTYYGSYTRTVDFHIETRKRNGMVETVDELLAHKANVEEEIKKVLSIEDDSKKGNGLSQNLILSYKRGFKNGFAAITYNTVLARKN